jgi:hypothetical protein
MFALQVTRIPRVVAQTYFQRVTRAGTPRHTLELLESPIPVRVLPILAQTYFQRVARTEEDPLHTARVTRESNPYSHRAHTHQW